MLSGMVKQYSVAGRASLRVHIEDEGNMFFRKVGMHRPVQQ